MADILYTDTDEVRAALGLSAIELEDKLMEDVNLEDQLTVDLQGVYPNHAALHAAAIGGSPTTLDVYLDKVLKLYSQYACAVFLTPQLQMIAAQKVTDGDFEQQRFIKDNLKDTIGMITGVRDKYRRILTDAAGTTTAGAFVSQMAVSTPNYDPVLGA